MIAARIFQFGCLLLMANLSVHAAERLNWTRLPAIPDREGFAGPFVGVSKGALLVAGGANFPDKKPWEGGTKVWYDQVFMLEKADGEWRKVGTLLHPLGYGVSVTTFDGVICAGGSDAQGHHAEVFLLQWRTDRLRSVHLPALPKPCANFCGAMLGNCLYVAGGIEKPNATTALKTFWKLDFNNLKAGWQEMEAWPGPERMLATAGALDGSFYLFSGAALKAGGDGKPVREWLKDAYCFTPGKGWRRIADLPRVSVAAPTPAPVFEGQLLIIGGDDGAQINATPTEHKGFPRSILSYNPRADQWTSPGEVPFSLVTTTAVGWNGHIIVPGGEAKPGIRSTEVWSAAGNRPAK